MTGTQQIETDVQANVHLKQTDSYNKHVFEYLPDYRDDASIGELLGLLDKAADSIINVYKRL